MSPLYVKGLIDYGQQSANPTSPSPTEGSKYWNTSDDRKYVYNGSKWVKEDEGTVSFDNSNTTLHWRSEDIAGVTSWPAHKGGSGANFVAGPVTDDFTYSLGDPEMGGQKSIRSVAGESSLRTSTQSEDTYFNGTEAWSVMVVVQKDAQTSGGSHGDGLFIHTSASSTDGSWSLDATGDHTWGNGFGEEFSEAGGFTSYPRKGILLVRMDANGGNGQLAWYDGTWQQRATCTSLPSSLPTNFDSINIFNFQTSSGNHDFVGAISEIVYYKGTRIADSERDAFTTYAVSKFW